MSKPTAEEIAQDIAARMRASGHHVMTVKWKPFYEMTGRERVTAPFLENIEVALKAESILMATGVTVIAFLIDYDFAPIRPLKAPSMPAGEAAAG